MASSVLKSTLDKYQGCLVGALMGDCLGAPFEGTSFAGGIPVERIKNVISPEKLATKQKGTKMFTDDTAMLKSVCSSLLQCSGFDSVDMANRFTKEYFRDRNRGYGGGVLTVFNEWANNGINYQNVYQPARAQFDGSGSYGNGGAMRVAPVALFATTTEQCVDIARQQAKLTHTHKSGFNGAILQALAVFKVVNSQGCIVWQEFIQELIEEMSKIENYSPTDSTAVNENDCELSEVDRLYEHTRSDHFTYVRHLRTVEELLTQYYQNKDVDDTENVMNLIGRDITAAQAVPAAIYCFLRNLGTSVEETLYYTISLGGDTDTVATMCMAMVGANCGYEQLPEVWKNVCESEDEVKKFAQNFFDLLL